MTAPDTRTHCTFCGANNGRTGGRVPHRYLGCTAAHEVDGPADWPDPDICDGARPCIDDPSEKHERAYEVYDDDSNRTMCCAYHAYKENDGAWLM